MTIKKLSSREFNQDLGAAKRAALEGPVFITDRGKPAHVLLSIEQFQYLTAGRRSLLDALSMSGMDDIEFDPPKIEIGLRVPKFD